MPRRKYSYIHQDLQKLARPIEELTPDPKNARTHGDRNMSAIRGSLKEFGFRGAIIAQKSGDELIVRAGNGRLEAARQLGWSHVPVLVYSDDDKTSAAFALADNRTAELAAWDFEQIAGLIKEGALDEEIDIGFSSEEIQRILDGEILPLGESDSILDGEDAGEREGLTDPDEVPEEPEEPITKTGDLWILGDHRLLCGDSTKADEVARLMDGEKADMVFTDPPYGMFLENDRSDLVRIDPSGWKPTPKNYKKVIGDHGDFSSDLIKSIFSSAPNAKEIFIWGGDYFPELLPHRNEGSWVTWDKRVDESLDTMMGSMFELCWSKVRHKREIARIRWIGFQGTEQEHDHKRVHPTQKPTALAVWFFERWGKGLNIVMDLFGGSGSTLIACEKTKRKCRMMELDRGYCDVIVKRWEDFTGKKAHLSKK